MSVPPHFQCIKLVLLCTGTIYFAIFSPDNRLELLLSSIKPHRGENRWNCRSLCWLKKLEESGNVTYKVPPRCAGVVEWLSVNCPGNTTPLRLIWVQKHRWCFRSFFFIGRIGSQERIRVVRSHYLLRVLQPTDQFRKELCEMQSLLPSDVCEAPVQLLNALQLRVPSLEIGSEVNHVCKKCYTGGGTAICLPDAKWWTNAMVAQLNFFTCGIQIKFGFLMLLCDTNKTSMSSHSHFSNHMSWSRARVEWQESICRTFCVWWSCVFCLPFRICFERRWKHHMWSKWCLQSGCSFMRQTRWKWLWLSEI